MTIHETQPDRADKAPGDDPDEPAGEGGSSSTDVKAPFEPHEDDGSAVGDTDQHSDA